MGNRQHQTSAEVEPSEFYKACHNGEVEAIRRILLFEECSQLDILEPNGDTSLHAACRQGHYRIVYILLQKHFSRDLINTHTKKTAYEEAANDQIRSLFCRHHSTEAQIGERALRFYSAGYDPFEVFFTYSEREAECNSINNQAILTNLKDAKRSRYMARFNTSPTIIHKLVKRMTQRECIERMQTIFELVNNSRLKEKCQHYFDRFIHQKDSNALLRIYTFNSLCKAIREHADAYSTLVYLNLASMSERAYQGRSYRGITMTIHDVARYYYAFNNKDCVIEMRNFSSTSKDIAAAKVFSGFEDPKSRGLYSVLFIYEFNSRCPTAIDLARINEKLPPISEYEDEQEVLILPYTVFEVAGVTEQTETQPFTLYLRNVLVPKASLLSFITGNID